MHRIASITLFVIIGFFSLLPAHAVQPDEILDDPVLEERARKISAGLRCLVCQNQSIDDSDAELAKDLRVLVRERLVAGDDDAAVKQFLVSRYGEFVLLKPTFSSKNLILWGFAPLILLLGFFITFRLYRQNKAVSQQSEQMGANKLSEEEQARLNKILQDQSKP